MGFVRLAVFCIVGIVLLIHYARKEHRIYVFSDSLCWECRSKLLSFLRKTISSEDPAGVSLSEYAQWHIPFTAYYHLVAAFITISYFLASTSGDVKVAGGREPEFESNPSITAKQRWITQHDRINEAFYGVIISSIAANIVVTVWRKREEKESEQKRNQESQS